ncbi:hypothetical protein H4V97_001156 [Flavobacterium sp. CG_23.5]|nr:hypothetical protein [Flavobacterium sp. CG_9.10]MBP2282838.1 hypothetical protein [Flavobacterium sp. CG_23.5]
MVSGSAYKKEKRNIKNKELLAKEDLNVRSKDRVTIIKFLR